MVFSQKPCKPVKYDLLTISGSFGELNMKGGKSMKLIYKSSMTEEEQRRRFQHMLDEWDNDSKANMTKTLDRCMTIAKNGNKEVEGVEIEITDRKVVNDFVNNWTLRLTKQQIEEAYKLIQGA